MVDEIVKKDVLIEKLSSVLRLVYDRVGQEDSRYMRVLQLLQAVQIAAPKNINFDEAFSIVNEVENSVKNLPVSIDTRARNIAARLISSDLEIKKKYLVDPEMLKRIEQNIAKELS